MRRKYTIIFLIVSLIWSNQVTKAKDLSTVLDLEQSIAIALERSAFLHSAKEEVRGAEFKKKVALSEFFPKLKTGYNYTHLNEPPHSTAPRFGPVPQRVITFGPSDTYVWTVTMEQPLFTGWSLITNYQLAKLGVNIAKIKEQSSKLDLILQVKEAYYSILKAEKILNVAIQAEKQVEEHVKVARAFYEVGITPKNDLLEAEVELAKVKQDLIRAENGLNIAKSKFNVILRRDINEPVVLVDILDYIPFTLSLDDCIQKAYKQRPEMKEVELKIEQARKQVKLSKSQFYPNFSLIFNYERQGDRYDVRGSDFKDAESWKVIAAMEWTFWEWGKTYYSVNESKVRLIQAEDALIQTRDAVTLEVKETYLNLKEAEKNIFVAQRAIDQAEENFRMNKERYKEQEATTTEVMDAQTLLTQAQTNYYNALSDYNIARARLERAMGLEG